MSTKTMNGTIYARLLLGGASSLVKNIEELNALNVFPVPDGDTGTNMAKTVDGGLAAISENVFSIGEVSNAFARGVLLSARGNSGVILSQIFAGINEGLKDFAEINAVELAEAYKKGVARSYKAVQNPTEGTILTVFRESTEYAAANVDETSTIEEFYSLHIEQARKSLAATKDILPVLAEADVVDSGGAGYLCIAEGMMAALSGDLSAAEYTIPRTAENNDINIDSFTRDSKLEFGYCTEFLLRLMTEKVDPDSFEISVILKILEDMKGESIVAYKQDDIVKVHVHTFTPGDVLSRMQAFGEFLTVKIENMSVGHSEKEASKPTKKKPYSVVTVSSGEGMAALFKDMGADVVIEGGQTANPSTGEFLEAFKHCQSKHIIVLPNNKNIILAAKQAADLFADAQVHIIETKNLMQGYSALSVITPGITDIEILIDGAIRAAASVVDGEITRAVRDATIDGASIWQGDYMAISEGKIAAVATTAEEAVMTLLNKADADLCEIITLFAGKNVSAEKRNALVSAIEENYEDCEVIVYEGGQELYDYYIALE